MIIVIRTTEDTVNYRINDEGKKPTNDEICRGIAHLEVVKQELLGRLSYDYEITENREE